MYSLISPANTVLPNSSFSIGKIYALVGPIGSFTMQFAGKTDTNYMPQFYIDSIHVDSIINHSYWLITDDNGIVFDRINIIPVFKNPLIINMIVFAEPNFQVVAIPQAFPSPLPGSWTIDLVAYRYGSTAQIDITMPNPPTGYTGGTGSILSLATTGSVVINVAANAVYQDIVLMANIPAVWTGYVLIKNPNVV